MDVKEKNIVVYFVWACGFTIPYPILQENLTIPIKTNEKEILTSLEIWRSLM